MAMNSATLRTFAEDALPEGGRAQTLVVSAYYSPLPDQAHYLRGNYEAEVKLNGRGTNGASGKEVYPGMLAAPKSYPFGTKVYIPGLGVGTVQDRGGAIIDGADYDRIDIWMGQGEEGLARALQWGMRRVEGIIYSPETAVEESLAIHNLPAPQTALPSPQLFAHNLALGDQGAEVEKLQEQLAELGFLSAAVTGNYEAQTKDAVFAFQKSVGLIAAPDQYGAGVFGPKTRTLFEGKVVAAKDISLKTAASAETPESSVVPVVAGLHDGSSGLAVKKLQIILANLGYFDSEFSGYFGPETTAAVIAFQKNEGIISDEQNPGAGVFGPKTKKQLDTFIAALQEKHEDLPKELALLLDAPETGKIASDEVAPTEPELPTLGILENSEKLSFGATGEKVALLQEKLIAAGYLPNGHATGYYGEKTRQAVLKLQEKHALIPNTEVAWAGEFGNKTEAVLAQELQQA